MIINVTYIDGTVDKFESKSGNLTLDNENSEIWTTITENPHDEDSDDYDSDDDMVIVEIRTDEIRKIEYE
jgi:hypothetical protein